MVNYQHLKQAEHNENTCKFLSGKGPQYTDWVITTAFYSALHFVLHKILPVEIVRRGKKIKVTTFESLYKLEKHLDESKHRFTIRYLEENHNDIDGIYNQMYDLSYNARYVNYQFDQSEAGLAKRRLKAIREYCKS